MSIALLLIIGLASETRAKEVFDSNSLRDIGYFLSDFTECNFYDERREDVIANDSRLLSFAYCHIIRDERDSLITEVPECVQTNYDKCARGFFKISADKIANLLRHYLAYDVKKILSADNCYYREGFYYFPANGGEEQPLLVLARKVKRLDDGNLEVQASLYNGEVQIRPKTNDIHLIAVIRPQIFETKNTWSLVSIKLLTDIRNIDFNPETDYSKFHPVKNSGFSGGWENEENNKNTLEITDINDQLGNHTVISRHFMSASKRIECSGNGVLNDEGYIMMVEPQDCFFVESSNDNSPDRYTATYPELKEVLLVNDDGKLIVPMPCSEQNESTVSLCAVSYRKVKR